MAIILEFPRPEADRTPDAEIIAVLKTYLERAERGEVRSLILVAAGSDGHPECAMQIDRGDAASLIGTLRVAENRISAALEATVD